MPIKESVTPQDVVDLLNEALEIDRSAIEGVFTSASNCNMQLADHPTIQVRWKDDGKEEYSVGILGILNGLFGTDDDGRGAIATVVDDNDAISKFIVL